MSVPDQIPLVIYAANGETNIFPITFDLHDERYLDVLINKELAPVGSYIIENLQTGKKQVNFRNYPRKGDEITLARSTSKDRETNFNSYNGSFNPSALNWDLDKIWHRLQEQYVLDAHFLARLKNEIETRRTSDSLLQHQIDILNDVLIGVFDKASREYLDQKLNALAESLRVDGAKLVNSLNEAINQAAANGAGANGWTDLFVLTGDGRTQRQVNEVSLKNGDYAPVLGSPVRLKLNPIKASFLYGINDPTHLDDNLNIFRGLNNQNAWDDSNIAIGGVAFGRNNVPFAYLSTALGHDCVAYGVASFVGGAGSATGNPDVPADGATYGYCSFAWGKDTQARGRISNAMGERCLSEGMYSSTDGYLAIAGKKLSTHPNYNLYGDEGIAGTSSRAHGYDVQAFGNFAFSYGALLRAYNGAQLIGRGSTSSGSYLELSRRGLGLGYNVKFPTIFCKEGNGVDADGASIGFNTHNPISRYDFRMGRSDTVTHIIESTENSAAVAFEVKGLLGNGTLGSLHNLVITHPNAGQAFGDATYYLNGNPYLRVDQTRKASFTSGVETGAAGLLVGGNRVVGGQLPAIADSTGTTADNQRAINAILAALRSHGLIAT